MAQKTKFGMRRKKVSKLRSKRDKRFMTKKKRINRRTKKNINSKKGGSGITGEISIIRKSESRYYGWRQVHTIGDGNCGYYSIIEGIKRLRIQLPNTMIVRGDIMRLNENNYSALTVKNLRKITGRLGEEWLTDEDIQILCNRLQICVKTIIDLSRDEINATVLPSGNNEINWCQGRLIHIINLNQSSIRGGLHFDLLLPPSSSQLTPPPSPASSTETEILSTKHISPPESPIHTPNNLKRSIIPISPPDSPIRNNENERVHKKYKFE